MPMTDQNRTGTIMNAILEGGSAPVWPTGLKIRLMSTVGSTTSNGTECTAGNSPGYTAGGLTITYSASSSGVSASSDSQTWTATGTWTAGVAGVEIWDTAGTPLRWFFGALTVAIAPNSIVNTNTLVFNTGSVTNDASGW